ncbi:phenylacetate--CoA ligase family protein [Catenuloplanes atrovinosus]|uniref:Phenylacetate-CoA ligase n=1 Tax=Catenuloplanes atrovinosus TaxID=137266 RepID=A0AAE3YHX0_9ACTN|nr:AMP-binding protein [Catenuloplanes atrovinosus]MDR7273994.1 phenylacetate-CoA ligase [Catenuloplanes atrovinosus]
MSDRPELGDWNDPAGLAAIQDARLPHTLAAAARSPFYRARGGVPADRAGLAAMPLTTKADLRGAYPFGMLAVDRRRVATYHESSGTTGTPTSSYYTEQDWLDLAERYARKWVGIRDDDTFLVRTPYALMITGHLAQAAARMRGATVVPADNRSTAMPYARVVRVLHDLDVTLTWSMPTDTLLWAAAAHAAGRTPGRDFPALRALFVGGEPLGAAKRARIAHTWNATVVEEYGATECGSLAGECPAGRLHLWADRAIFEVRDPATGRTTPAGRGHLVVTPLYREAMPLLRYDTEDLAEVSDAPCPCGWALPTVRVLGRGGAVHRVAGTAVTQGDLEELVLALPGVLFWRARALPDRLVVELEADRDTADALVPAIRARYGVPAQVTALPPGALVPRALLTAAPDVVKPRALFGPDEDWAKALSYY